GVLVFEFFVALAQALDLAFAVCTDVVAGGLRPAHQCADSLAGGCALLQHFVRRWGRRIGRLRSLGLTRLARRRLVGLDEVLDLGNAKRLSSLGALDDLGLGWLLRRWRGEQVNCAYWQIRQFAGFGLREFVDAHVPLRGRFFPSELAVKPWQPIATAAYAFALGQPRADLDHIGERALAEPTNFGRMLGEDGIGCDRACRCGARSGTGYLHFCLLVAWRPRTTKCAKPRWSASGTSTVSVAASASRSRRQSAAASMLISVRRPTAISRGPRPKFLILKYMDCEMR